MRVASAPKRHANAELLRALVDRKTHHAVEADTGKNERDDSEDGEERRDHAVAGENLVVKLRGRSGEIGRQIRIELSDRLAQRRPERVRALTGTRPNDYGGKLRGRRGAEQRHVESGGLGLLIERTLHQRVRHDADDGSPRLLLAGIEDAHLMSERALVAPMFSGEARIHDRDRLLRVGVVDA